MEVKKEKVKNFTARYNVEHKKKRNKNFKVLSAIENDLYRFGIDEVNHYASMFPNEVDFNIAQYGNLIIYYDDVREFYMKNGFIDARKLSDYELWDLYKYSVGLVARTMLQGAYSIQFGVYL